MRMPRTFLKRLWVDHLWIMFSLAFGFWHGTCNLNIPFETTTHRAVSRGPCSHQRPMSPNTSREPVTSVTGFWSFSGLFVTVPRTGGRHRLCLFLLHGTGFRVPARRLGRSEGPATEERAP